MKRNKDKISLWKRKPVDKIGYYWNPDPMYEGLSLTKAEYDLVRFEKNHLKGIETLNVYRRRCML